MKLSGLKISVFSGIASIAFAVGACGTLEKSTDIAQKRIFTRYSAKFLETEKKLEFGAYFSIGNAMGNPVHLEKESSVQVDGVSMSPVSDKSAQYAFSRENLAEGENIEATHVFVYRNNDGAQFTNEVKVPGRVTFVLPSAQALNVPLVVTWSLENPVNDDVIDLRLVSRSDNTRWVTKTTYLAAGQSSGSFSINTDDLTVLGQGKVAVHIERARRTKAVQVTEAGATLRSEFVSATREVNLQ